MERKSRIRSSLLNKIGWSKSGRLGHGLAIMSAILVLGLGTVARAQMPVPAASELPAPVQVVAFTFDWDDNVFEMPTKIMLFHKKTGVQRGVSTDDFALIRDEIGKPGSEFADFELRQDKSTGSLRYFGDFSEDGTSRFQMDVNGAMETEGWKGPVWEDFVAAASRKSTADLTWFVTARLHAPATIHGAIQSMKDKGLIQHVPPLDNIWPVSEPDFSSRFERVFGKAPPEGSVDNPSARKAAVMEFILDRIQATPFPEQVSPVLSPDGRTRGPYHLWGFSDDDYGNYQKAVEVLQKGANADRWSHVKITVFFSRERIGQM